MAHVEKLAAEKFPITIDFADRLPTGASVVSGTAAAYQLPALTNVSSTLLVSTTVSVASNKGTVVAQAGTAGVRYRIVLSMTLSSSYILEEIVTLEVIDRGQK